MMNALAAGVAVGTLGDGGDLDVVEAELIEHRMRRGELAGAAVDQDEIGRGPSFHLAFALGELAEAPRQHLAHHGVVVTRGKVFALHIELPVLAFDEAFRSGNDHGADRVRAGDVAVVVNLDALGRLVEIDELGEAGEDRGLRGRLGEPVGRAPRGH